MTKAKSFNECLREIEQRERRFAFNAQEFEVRGGGAVARERLRRPLLPQRPGTILHNFAVGIVKRDACDYATALRQACYEHPQLAVLYQVENAQREYSQSGDPHDLPSPEQAGELVATYAKQIERLEHVSYSEALALVRKRYPDVFRLYEEGTPTLKHYRGGDER